MIDVIGEALVDLVIEPDGAVSAKLGGAPLNTARACGRLAMPVRFLGALSIDRFGQLLRAQLVADGVDDVAAVTVDAPTTLAAAEVNEGGAAQYRFYVDGTSAPLVKIDDLPDMSNTAALYTGGLALILEPMATAVEHAIGHAGDSTLVMVDINCRPLFIPDRETYVARVVQMLPKVDVVKVSDEDLAYMFPDFSPVDAAQKILAAGPAVALVTAGGEAVHIVTAAGVEIVEVPKVAVVDTIGAGDSFSAGFLSWWTGRGYGITDLASTDLLVSASQAATRVAAIVVGRRGADPPWRTEVASDFPS